MPFAPLPFRPGGPHCALATVRKPVEDT